MIQKSQYLQNFTDMTQEEKLKVATSADEWNEKYPSLIASFNSWMDAPVKDIDEGLLLCTCLRRAHSFVQNAYQFNAKRCCEIISMTLGEILRIHPVGARTEEDKKKNKHKVYMPAEPTENEDGETPKKPTRDELKKQEAELMEAEKKADNWRPAHVDDYVNLLPKDMQKNVKAVKKNFYMPRAEYRARLESLAENPDATQEQRAEMAKRLADIDDALRAFWAEVDAEYNRIIKVKNGEKVDVEEETPEVEVNTEEVAKNNVVKADTDAKRKARINADKKMIRDKALNDVTPEMTTEIEIRAIELKLFKVPFSQKIQEVLDKFGIKIESYTAEDDTEAATETEDKVENEAKASEVKAEITEEPKVAEEPEAAEKPETTEAKAAATEEPKATEKSETTKEPETTKESAGKDQLTLF